MKTFKALLVLSGLAWSTSAAAQPPAVPPPPPCTAAETQFICGLQAPEDLVVVPGGQWVVAGAYGGSGGVYLIKASDRVVTRVYPTATAVERLDAKTYSACPGAPDAAFKARFQTHGLYMLEGRNSVHRLFVVAHGGRESVEVFELDARPATPALTWIGCAVAANPIGLNSVQGLADGGFFATNFLPRGDPTAMKRAQSGERNGELWEWHTASGWQKVPGSEASGANGLLTSDDGKFFYVAAWGSQSFFRLSRGAATPSRDEIPFGFRVDNIRWARDGSILATGQKGDTPATQATVIVKVDPKTLKLSDVFTRPNDPAFGAGTVAVEVGKQLWIGSYRGDRILVIPAP
jgi:sugar lactone lactonase YvrE